MKSYRKELWFNVPGRRGFINITPQVEAALRESGVREGLCLVNAMHITARVFINDDESGLHHDYDLWLEKLAPHEPVSGYWHNRTGEDNADAHMKRQVMGREVVVAITAGRAGLRPVGADLLRRVRRRAAETRVGEGDRGVTGAEEQRGGGEVAPTPPPSAPACYRRTSTDRCPAEVCVPIGDHFDDAVEEETV